MADFTDEFLRMYGSQVSKQVSSNLGIKQDLASQLIPLVVPLILGGLKQQMTQQGGTDRVDHILNKYGSASVLDNIGEEVYARSRNDNPDPRLGGLLGESGNDAANAMAQQFGLDGNIAKKLIVTLAPLVLGALTSKRDSGGLGSNGISGLIDRDGDENILGNVASLLMRGPPSGRPSAPFGQTPGFGAAGSRKFDLRTTDMWLFLIQNNQSRRAWNILSPGVGTNQRLNAEPGTPSIVMPRDNGKFEIHVRLKNFGNQPVSARIEGQTVEHTRAATHQGEPIVTDYQNIPPGGEAVYKQQFPTWAQSNDQRTWVAVGNERQELVDFRGSSRHLTYIDVRSGNI